MTENVVRKRPTRKKKRCANLFVNIKAAIALVYGIILFILIWGIIPIVAIVSTIIFPFCKGGKYSSFVNKNISQVFDFLKTPADILLDTNDNMLRKLEKEGKIEKSYEKPEKESIKKETIEKDSIYPYNIEKYNKGKKYPVYVTCLRKDLTCTPDPDQVILLDNGDEKIIQLITENKEKIDKTLSIRKATLVFSHLNDTKSQIKEILSYNQPQLTAEEIEQLANKPIPNISDQLKANILPKLPDVPLFIRYNPEITTSLDSINRHKGEDDPEYRYYFSIFTLEYHDDSTLISSVLDYAGKIKGSNILYHIEGRPDTAYSDVDDEFEYQTIAQEILDRIQKLRMMGVNEMLIRNLIDTPAPISHLNITEDFKIILSDYNNKEIKLTPIAKALFFLFIRHPEGIMLKELSDYKEELKGIYHLISKRENPEKMETTINDITNPFNNSINEKCSRIKEAFLKEISDNLASHYYITGKAQTPKVITLDRSLIIDNSHVIIKQ